MSYELIVAAYDFICAYGNKKDFITKCADNGVTKLRIFWMMSWDKAPNEMQPYLFYEKYPKWNFGYKDGPLLPVYDLTKPNPAYWSEFDQICSWAKEAGLGIQAVLQDRCTQAQREWKKYLHPFFGSFQKRDPLSSDPEHNKIPGGHWGIGRGVLFPNGLEPCTGYSEDQTMQFWHKQWTCEQRFLNGDPANVVERMNMIGVKYDLDLTNEFWAMDWPIALQSLWPEWYADYLRKKRTAGIIPSDCKFIFSSIGEAGPAKIFFDATKVDLYSLHGFVRPEKVRNETGISNARVFISGDGGYDGSGLPDANGRHGLGIEDAERMADSIDANGFPHTYEILFREMYTRGSNGLGSNDRANVDNADFHLAYRMAKRWGWNPVQYIDLLICNITKLLPNKPYCPEEIKKFEIGKEPKIVCSLHQKPPEPEKSCWERFMANRPVRKWQIGKFLKCIFKK